LVFLVIRNALLLLCASLTLQQAFVWRTEEGLWGQAVQVSPLKPGPHLALGVAYQHEGRFDRARAEYAKAIEVSAGWPDQDQYWFATGFNLAKILSLEGKPEKAMALLDALQERFPERFENVQASKEQVRLRMVQ
jgi:tetratricopeptide (TPR) repeat protein